MGTRAMGRIVLVGCIALATTAARADSVSGQFELDGKLLAPNEVAAFRVRNQTSPRDFETYVLLTTKAVNRELIRVSVDPRAQAHNDEAVIRGDVIALHVQANDKITLKTRFSGKQYVDSSAALPGQPPVLVASCSVNSAVRVACRVSTDKVVSAALAQAWSVNLSFDTAVLTHAVGKPLPRDGGAPGDALRALVAGLNGNDFDAILALLSEGAAVDFQESWRSPAENLKVARTVLGKTMPQRPLVTGGELWTNDHAVLEVEGTTSQGIKLLYLVEMRRVHGQWVFDSSRSVGTLTALG